MFELGRSTSPRLTAKLSKPRCPPGGALLLEPTARQWFAEPNVLKSDFDTLVGLEARAVSESETEAERLRAHARRPLELARAINVPEAALRLMHMPLNSWKGQMPSSGRTRAEFA